MNFIKYQGAGNDFVLIDMRKGYIQLTNDDRANICHRKFGIGADGILEILESSKADFKLIYYNANGCVGSLCGNGSRCSMAYFLSEASPQTKVTFECDDKIYAGGFTIDNLYYMKMGDIKFRDIEIYDNNNFYVNNGSPHHVRFVTSVDKSEVATIGQDLCYGQYGKDGCNINFCEVLQNKTVKVRTFERGVDDETLACGTGATAVALITHYKLNAIAEDVADISYDITMPGGTLSVSFSIYNDVFTDIKLTGPATKVFSGIFFY